MQTTNTPHTVVVLATGIKYPPAVEKAYKAQLEAEAKHTAAVQAWAEAEGAIATAEAQDQADLVKAVTNGDPVTDAVHIVKARRQLEYAVEAVNQAHHRYLAAGAATQAALKENIGGVLPLVIENARGAVEAYETARGEAQRIVDRANEGMSNAARALNQLRKAIPNITYEANFVPATLSITDARNAGTLMGVVNRLETIDVETAISESVNN